MQMTDPLDARQNPYEILGIDSSASKKEIDHGLMLALRRDPKKARDLRRARGVLSRLAPRLQYDLLCYSVADELWTPPDEANHDEVPLADPPLPPIPVEDLVDVDLALEGSPFPDPIAQDGWRPPVPQTASPPVRLPIRLDD